MTSRCREKETEQFLSHLISQRETYEGVKHDKKRVLPPTDPRSVKTRTHKKKTSSRITDPANDIKNAHHHSSHNVTLISLPKEDRNSRRKLTGCGTTGPVNSIRECMNKRYDVAGPERPLDIKPSCRIKKRSRAEAKKRKPRNKFSVISCRTKSVVHIESCKKTGK